MEILNFLKQMGKSGLLEAKIKTNILIVKSAYDQIVDNLKSISESNDNSDYYWIITEMKNHLNYKEVELLVDLTNDLPNTNIFLSVLEKEKFFWERKIESGYSKDIECAKISLCTSDFLAFVIGKKYDLHLLINKNSFWSKVYSNIALDINVFILQSNLLCNLEGIQKAHVPVNYALSMFLLHKKKEALAKFKRILSNDREHRLEGMHQAEYFLTVENFFSRLKLNFIPQINYLNQLKPINFENENNQYITKDEIKILIDKEDYFNKRNFVIDKKYLLRSVNICDEKKLKELYFTFFNFFDNKISKNQIEVLYSCFTEINPKYEEYQIKIIRIKLIELINEKEIAKDLIYFSYYLVTNVLDSSYEKIKFLTSTFFNTKGLSASTISDVFSDRFGKDKSYSSELPRSLVDKINDI
ncbi:hypothetical protein E0I26_01985 [Flavobacterium rhamnosiphilum]|uniref:Uncharacterized protein n=1 Tax=Flavobacterium rhamnosiphilum TaxID=2541724 RepID=A0A4R5FD47_9FLAO|nr:hypothetical protein [Flavobacterium rhamnosiphilum]TDE46880.1 hypothetical protein E0I26_01985 [Flavobacterium rhamnosiphilum]